jgi:hypothetical protein
MLLLLIVTVVGYFGEHIVSCRVHYVVDEDHKQVEKPVPERCYCSLDDASMVLLSGAY